MWEAADAQWWWRRPRATDELALPVWFDEVGPVAAAGLTAWDDTWQADVFAVPSVVEEEDVWAATLEAAAGHRGEALEVLVREDDAPLVDLAVRSGFTLTDELSGTAGWTPSSAAGRAGRRDHDRRSRDRADRPHPMIARNGERVEPRLRQCSLYDPTLDLAVEDADGTGRRLRLSGSTTRRGSDSSNRCASRTNTSDAASPACCSRTVSIGSHAKAAPPESRLRDRRRPQPLRSAPASMQTSVDRRLTRPAQRLINARGVASRSTPRARVRSRSS